MSDLLDPRLPFDMGPRAERALEDAQLQRFVSSAARAKDLGRMQACAAAFGDRYNDLRELAGRIRQHTLDHLDTYLERFVERASAAGAQVHFAADGREANEICLRIARDNGCTRCVKSKSMVTEETRLGPALQAAGIEAVETDLGEFIVQLDGDAPSHIVTPMIHKDRNSVSRAFVRELGAEPTDDPEELTAIARAHLREKFRSADLGVTGANFLLADTGSLVIVSNEGNAGLTVNGPRIHVAFVGIEKVVPERRHLPVFLKLLARSATSQAMTVYTTFVTGPRRPEDHDGPEQLHIVLVDNGRTEVLREKTRELLRCIRCGACLNACPVYRKVGGGHAYGAVYSGPIGAVLTPLLKGLENYRDLPQASSLCGACFEACPVKIDIPRHLVALREEMVRTRLVGWRERLALRLWASLLKRPLLYRTGQRLLRLLCRRGWKGPRGWAAERDLPEPPARSFLEWWKENRS